MAYTLLLNLESTVHEYTVPIPYLSYLCSLNYWVSGWSNE